MNIFMDKYPYRNKITANAGQLFPAYYNLKIKIIDKAYTETFSFIYKASILRKQNI